MRPLAPILALACAASAQAQFLQRLLNPTVKVYLAHPPGFGVKVQRLGVVPTGDARSEELAALCRVELAGKGGLELVDRARLDALLEAGSLSASALEDAATARALGETLGGPLLLFVDVRQCAVIRTPEVRSRAWKDVQGVERQDRTYIARTQLVLRAALRAVDCASGKVLAGHSLACEPYLENRSDLAQPAFPAEAEVRDMALRQALRQVRRLLLPWKERRDLVFYADPEYGMKEAYLRLRSRDYRGAVLRATQALEKAKADPRQQSKYLARAHYNLGICQFLQGDLAAALPELQAALGLERGHGIYREAVVECRRGLHLKEQLARLDQPPEQPAAAGGMSLEERLERLERLKEKGLVSAEEYRLRRTELLNEL